MTGERLERCLRGALWGAPVAAMACTVLTHADQYAVVSSDASSRLCDFCPQHPELAHAPCPGGDSPGGEATYFYAAQKVDLGDDINEWGLDNTLFAVGLDLDCSARLPDGVPVLCQSTNAGQWKQPLPVGVDNAFGQVMLQPLYAAYKPSYQVNAWILAGQGGFVFVVDHWNGQADDAQVGFRMLPAVGPSRGGTPTFDKGESWDVYADGWDPSITDAHVPTALASTSTAYVVQGVLVADLRSAGDLAIQLGGPRVGDAGPVVALSPEQVEIVGPIVPTVLQVGLAGLLVQANTFDSKGLAQVVTSCDPTSFCPVATKIEQTKPNADDMPSVCANPPCPSGGSCDSISFGIHFVTAQIAGVGNIEPLSEVPTTCNESCAGAGDAGAEGE
jgi:hypothetical protein